MADPPAPKDGDSPILASLHARGFRFGWGARTPLRGAGVGPRPRPKPPRAGCRFGHRLVGGSMKPRFPSPGFLAASALAAAPASAQPSFQGLGFLPAYERSAASAVSADGLIVVGSCINEETNTTRAF